MSSPQPLLTVRSLSKRYGNLQVLKDFSLDVHEREKLVLIGPSGSGKTTVLRCLMTVEQASGGQVRIGDLLLDWTQGVKVGIGRKLLSAYRGNFGMVFQQFNLFPHMTVLENLVEGPIHVLGRRRTAAVEDARRLLATVGLESKLNEYPSRLSGGQQQRVAIVRALAMQPKILLLDEITSALDPERVGEVLEVVRRLSREENVAMIIVTHEMAFARDVADRVLFMDEGVIVEAAPGATLFDTPRNDRTRAFLRTSRHMA
ncbi:MAG: amino acid ABC transporter ATP-binding protein [Parvibaculaceae bacterium]